MKTDLTFLPEDLESVRVDRAVDSLGDAEPLEITRHVFDRRSIVAVNAALAASRPLLVRGEPGVGKTQLAAAVAACLKRPLVSCSVNSRTEATDLLWTFDAVQRLAEAQLCGVLSRSEAASRERLCEWRFVSPGPLWWGFDWKGALKHRRQCAGLDPEVESNRDADFLPDSGGDPRNGVVVLIDEIDKADADVPNGLLEALGARQFTPFGCRQVLAHAPFPLVLITTNEERVLPDAFVRRCLVLHLPPPDKKELIDRGIAHFGTSHGEVLEKAADQLMRDRQNALPPRPGLAEYLDLVRAVLTLAPVLTRDASSLIEELAAFTFRKQSGGQK